LDAAGPVGNHGTEVQITNYLLENRHLTIKDLPSALFPKKTVFINDLVAACEGIIALGEDGRLSEFFQPLWSPFQEDIVKLSLKNVTYVVMAMGTGLGSAVLLPQSTTHSVLPTENGHTSLTPLGPFHPDYKEECELLEFISKKIYGGQQSIEWEDICSGRGLVSCYQFLTRNDVNISDKISALDVVQQALEQSDPKAEKALLLHYKYLFRISQQQSIGMIAKGVFLAGDNQVSNDSFVIKHIPYFKEEYLRSTKKEWILETPVYRQTKSYNLNLLGCLHYAKKNS